MNRKLLLGVLFFVMSFSAFAQQKIKDGTLPGNNLPNKDAILELESSNKGFLHTRVPLKATINASPLQNHVAGMMVYNTATEGDVTPGIYYNDGAKWVSIKSSNVSIVESQPGKTGAPGKPGATGGPGQGIFIVNNDAGSWVFNPVTEQWTMINKITETLTSIKDNGNGTITYKDENGNETIINMAAGAAGANGLTPTIGANGNWFIGTTDTGVPAKGLNGTNGIDGLTPTIGINGNWFFGTTDTGVPAKGNDGRSVTSSVTAPAAGDGNDGDSHVNTTTGDIYTKSGGVWTVTGNVKGPKGDAGAPGVIGVEGMPGTSGTPGIPGSGTPGAPGDGITIVNNDSGTWVYNPTTKTWTNINGPKGDAGLDGKSITSGTTAPAAGDGNDGDSHVNTTTGDIYTKSGGVWTVTGNVKGPKGDAGAQGPIGITGPAGPNGVATPLDLAAAGGDNSITVTNGAGTTLKNTFLNVTGGGITTAKLANEAVTTDKIKGGIADQVMITNAAGDVEWVQRSGFNRNWADGNTTVISGTGTAANPNIVEVADGAISTVKLKNGAVTTNKIADGDANQVLTTDVNGKPVWVNQSEVGEILEAKNGLNKAGLDIKLGGTLIEPTTITTDAPNTLAIAGLQSGVVEDRLVVAEADGTLRQVKAAMPKFFYMPAIIFNTSVNGTFTRNLHTEYQAQFTGTGNPTLVSSAGATNAIPTLPANELEYHITYYDTAVFANLSIDANSVLTYDIIGNATKSSYMTIIFVVK